MHQEVVHVICEIHSPVEGNHPRARISGKQLSPVILFYTRILRWICQRQAFAPQERRIHYHSNHHLPTPQSSRASCIISPLTDEKRLPSVERLHLKGADIIWTLWRLLSWSHTPQWPTTSDGA